MKKQFTGGYGGEYKGNYLRSTLEYLTAVWLDRKKVKWVYEEKYYNFSDGHRYLPDFSVYDDNNKLLYIIEVKEEYNRYQEEIDYKFSNLRDTYDIECKLMTRKDLMQNLSDAYDLIDDWRTYSSENFSNSRIYSGENNPMYGQKHSEETKRKIGQATSERMKDPEYRAKIQPVWDTLGQRTKDRLTGVEKTERVEKICPQCGKTFRSLPSLNQEYCSIQCSGKVAAERATAAQSKESKNKRLSIKDYAEAWALEHKELVLQTKFNKITSTLHELYEGIQEEFGVKDARTISKAILDPTAIVTRKDKTNYSRKDMLAYLKDYVSKEL